MTAAELKNQTLVAAALAKQKGFIHTYDALIAIVRELETERLAQDQLPDKPQKNQLSHYY